MELDLNPAEKALLAEILEGYLSDLRMEVADTDNKDYRDSLKTREATVKQILAGLTGR